MIISAVMDEIGVQLKTISNLRVLAYDADDIETPAAVVSIPTVNFNQAYRNGMVVANLVITIFVSLANDRKRRDQITIYQDSSGPASVRNVLEQAVGSYRTFDSILVQNAIPAVVKIGDIDYFCLLFACEVLGRG